MITEVPLTAADNVTFTYLHNHMFQVKSWLGNLNKVKPSDELSEAYDHIEKAQDLIRKLIEEKGEK